MQNGKMEISFENSSGEAGSAPKGLYVSYVKSEGEHTVKTTPELLVPYSVNDDIDVYSDWTIDSSVSESDGRKTLTLTLDIYIKSIADYSEIIKIEDYKIQTVNSEK